MHPIAWHLLALLPAAAAWTWAARGGDAGVAIAASVGSVVALMIVSRRRRLDRERVIDTAPLPPYLHAELRQRYPGLDAAACGEVERGLRQFFQCHLRSRGLVAMPSQAVDALWHAFILDTRAYARFCAQAFGRFLHHRPAQTLGQDAARNDGLRRTWYHACKLEGIDPRAPAALPLLFALDARLAIPGGFHYLPDCRLVAAAGATGVHCGASFGDGGGGPGDAEGFGGEAGSSGGDGGDGGGCGGD